MRLLNTNVLRSRTMAVACTLGALCQFGGCNIGEITTTSTVDGRELVINLVRGAIIQPIDDYITGAIRNAFTPNQ